MSYIFFVMSPSGSARPFTHTRRLLADFLLLLSPNYYSEMNLAGSSRGEARYPARAVSHMQDIWQAPTIKINLADVQGREDRAPLKLFYKIFQKK